MPKSIYLEALRPPATPQSEVIPDREADMSRNAAGGFAFNVDDWERLNRFLILGTEGGTFYINEQKLTRENTDLVLRCLSQDGIRVVNRIVEISDGGLAPKNDPAIFALALAAKRGDEATRSLAYKSLNKVCRTGTHLFQFVDAIYFLDGSSSGSRKAIGRWYTEKDPDKLGYQIVKYRQRGTWSHRDVLRFAHAKGDTEATRALLAYAVNGASEGTEGLPNIVKAYEMAKTASADETASLIRNFDLPRECVNTEYLSTPAVQEALLHNSPLTALIRNLGNYSKSGVLTPFSDGTQRVIALLGNTENLRAARVHPMAIYLAMAQYSLGHGDLGKGEWKPVQSILDALDEAFNASMDNVAPSGVKTLHVIDNSGSMKSGYHGQMYTGLRAPIAMATAMAMVAVRTESQYELVVCNTVVHEAQLSKTMRLDVAIKHILSLPGGGTDLAMPYKYLAQKEYDVDAVVQLTDDETWAGNIHPVQVLDSYRRKVRHPVRNVIVSMVPTAHSIGDPSDRDTLQVVGLDASLPSIISGFLRGEL